MTRRKKSSAPVDPHEPVGCRSIEGDPHGVWAYCQKPQKPGSSYCPRHHARYYRAATEREEGELRAAAKVLRGKAA